MWNLLDNINTKWKIFCEESGDKGIPRKAGSSYHYIISAILVKEEDEQSLSDVIETYKWKDLRMRDPLEWKKLKSSYKREDKRISRFFRKIEQNGPDFLVSNVVCNKDETNGPGLVDRNTFMNYLYGLMFKRISTFLDATDSRAELVIDRNTDKMAQESLKNYISDVSRYYTGSHPRHTKPQWINPEDHPILGLADFVSGVSLRSWKSYVEDTGKECKSCGLINCMYQCQQSNFKYKRSYRYIKEWNYYTFDNWQWKGLIYHPYIYKNNYLNLIQPK